MTIVRLGKFLSPPKTRVAGPGALELLGNEWQGLALDFLTNTYALRTAPQAEQLLGSGPYTVEAGLGLSFLDNSYALGVA